jgi:hypothetical protein
MRSPEELERVAFRQTLTPEEDDELVKHFLHRASTESPQKAKGPLLKQAAFFASRAFDKGVRDPGRVGDYISVLASVQKVAPSESFRQKLVEMKAALRGRSGYEAALRKLGRKGTALGLEVLATEAQLDHIETSLNVKLPPSYRHYLLQYAHRQIGTYEPFTAVELEGAVREAWGQGLEQHLLPFLEDNGDYFCFDQSAKRDEPAVVFWPHDGSSNESWPNFVAWVEECWLAEL